MSDRDGVATVRTTACCRCSVGRTTLVQHHLTLPHKAVVAAGETVRVSGSAQPAVKLTFECLVLMTARPGVVRLSTAAKANRLHRKRPSCGVGRRPSPTPTENPSAQRAVDAGVKQWTAMSEPMHDGPSRLGDKSTRVSRSDLVSAAVIACGLRALARDRGGRQGWAVVV